MGNLTRNADKKSATSSKNDKTKEKRWNALGRKEKSYITRIKNTTLGNKSEGSGERNKTKKTSRQDKIIQTNQGISKQRKKSISK